MHKTSFKIQFLGAAGTVTGSKYLLDIDGKRIMIDCGMFQGEKALRLLNWEPPKYDPKSIDMIFLTHGHLDHTGYLPRLINYGLKAPIYGTYPTLDVAKIILKDTASIQEKEAERANREGYSKHHPAKPFYTQREVKKTISKFKGIPLGRWFQITENLRLRYRYNGHIIGATFIEMDFKGKRIVFSGDVGRKDDLLLFDPDKPVRADILFMESTYGGKLHPDEAHAIPEIERITNETLQRGGSIFIPSFSVERAQLLMFIFWRLQAERKIPKVEMILDSPTGSNVWRLFKDNRDWHKLDKYEYKAMGKAFTVVKSYGETMALRDNGKPKIVIAGSGMLTGGRMLNYLEKHAPNPKDTLIFVGYQAEGTRGRKLLEGEKTIKIYGKIVDFNMQMEVLEGLSAHADKDELLDWLGDIKQPPKQVFLVHGERENALEMKHNITQKFGWKCHIPQLFEKSEVVF